MNLAATRRVAGRARLHPSEAAIRVIRWLDRRSGIDGASGARVYDAVLVPLAGWLYEQVAADISSRLGEGTRATIVDVGTGPGALLVAVARCCPAATIVGIDPAPTMRRAAARRIARTHLSQRVTVIDGTAERLPLADGSVDIAVSTLASHHWLAPAGAMRELRRVLRPGGTALIYDLRFAGFTERELDRMAVAVGLEREAIRRRVLRGGRWRLFARITIQPSR
jgi:ubiquinone/menaquinone biosynthesis C-methylase UbiE